MKEVYKRHGERLFTGAWSDESKGNSFKLTVSRVRLDIRKNFSL